MFEKDLNNINLMPKIISDFGAFEMGYSYKICMNDKYMIFTTDFGILLLEYLI